MDDAHELGFLSHEWMLKALITHAPRDHLNMAVATLINYLIWEEELDAVRALDILAQVSATGHYIFTYMGDENDNPITEEEITRLSEWLNRSDTIHPDEDE